MPALLATPVLLVEQDGYNATAALDVHADEPVLSGHYPGFAVLPGVCVIDTVRRAAQLCRPADAQHGVFDTVESARFLEPVFPGDRMRITLRWEPGREGDGWRCTGAVTVEDGKVATIRLRYRVSEVCQ
ncbi:3-hydroxyacyl-[acyl-carrier-protein] dehydratase [Caldimonas brevitalea]|uniref:3-hydroxyacyl-[acyl-carrier-protein] dehydratase n=2 Tax=Caldimonas brevitalea TaxID=413882 RepID=A0A0G3BL10_9BURK|nr:3-hydroxyacyl-[acyl-carrier-protein] dehydratase [Caldimonas brevitalea]